MNKYGVNDPGGFTDECITQLNSFLRGEISAVETYRQALERVQSPSVRAVLEQNYRAHQQSVGLLQGRIQTLGGKPDMGSGAWGAFAKLVQGGANVFGEKAAISALEEGEDRGLTNYREDLSKLDFDSRELVERQLLVSQQRTHQAMSDLERSYNEERPSYQHL